MKESYDKKRRRILKKIADGEKDKILTDLKKQIMQDAKQLIRP